MKENITGVAASTQRGREDKKHCGFTVHHELISDGKSAQGQCTLCG